MAFCNRRQLGKNKLSAFGGYLGLVCIVIGLLVAGCGEEIPTKPAQRTGGAIVNLPQSTPVKITYTAGSGQTKEAIPTRTPVIQNRPENTPAIVNVVPAATANPTLTFLTPAPGNLIPSYDNLKPLNLDELGQTLNGYLTQNSPNAKTNYYYTSDSFEKLATFYNKRLEGLNFSKITEQILPTQLGLRGNVLIYSRGENSTLEVIAIMVLGPLDPNLTAAFAESAASAKVLKPGDSVVIVITGLTAADLSQMQKNFRSAGN